MELMDVIRRRSRSRDSDKHEGTPHGRRSPVDPDHPVHEDHDDDHSYYDSDGEMPEHFNRLHTDQLGRILLNIMKDQFQLAKKCNLKNMHTNMDEMCDSFNEFLQVNEVKRRENKMETQQEMENKMIQKQLNGHLQKQAFKPPAYFSPTPVINNSISKTSEIYKLFTNRNNKFSGNPKDSLSLLEFINSMNAAQEQAKLSEKEFKAMLLACTTGEAHKFLVDWSENSNEDVASTYHQLGLRFDNRIDPETARNDLFKYVATKDKTLAQVEGDIMALAYRACDIYPPGESRTMARDFEFCNSLIRSLPAKSSELVRRAHGDLSTMLPKAPTATELSRSLHNLRHIIDRDIKQNGADPSRLSRPRFQKGKSARKPYANYGIDRSVTPSRSATAFAESATYKSPPTRDSRRTQRDGHKREKSTQKNPSGGQNGSNGARRKTSNTSSRRPFNKRKGSSCSLCGQYNHQEPDTCPNMVTDSGTHIRLHPIQGTCSECPGNRKNTLHHPKSLCPWRPAGIFRKSSQ